ncbi:MAG TPA: endo alpha-1,4 polygalactosaminidase [Chitinophaga sp.]|uniref:endo alpha-1,4 polygalactosaminidase n=1 Tax=Chitinophaga sp. TaxID=1869181 RepID=UPI002C6C4BBA|nr:endo alpha-1,4 polygalactosaminidase [Chitinophaga sp.]HVI44383.1 endo alpha-1,4 polygalactosaminidase [Chitinophaga sp.]
MTTRNPFLSAAALACLLTASSCSKDLSLTEKNHQVIAGKTQLQVVNYRQEMRNFIQEISAWAKQQQNGFLIVAQNSSELLTNDGDAAGTVNTAYIKALDGVGREELYYGYDNSDDKPTPKADSDEWLAFCKVAASQHLRVLTTDYCFTPGKVANSYQLNQKNGFISFAASHRELDNIPAGAPFNENSNNINTLADARNFLYLINSGSFGSRTRFLDSLKATNYDVIVMDAFPESDTVHWDKSLITSLKTKKNGGKRIVLAYMSMGQAEQYRWYWKAAWVKNPPAWLETMDPYWKGNYYIRYWMPEWKAFIYGNSASYTQKLIDAGFDGAYLDPVDGSQHWEEKP